MKDIQLRSYDIERVKKIGKHYELDHLPVEELISLLIEDKYFSLNLEE